MSIYDSDDTGQIGGLKWSAVKKILFILLCAGLSAMYCTECIHSIQELSRSEQLKNKNKSAIMKNIENKTIVSINTTSRGVTATSDVKVDVKTIQNVNLEDKAQVKISKVGSKPAVVYDAKPFTAPSAEISH